MSGILDAGQSLDPFSPGASNYVYELNPEASKKWFGNSSMRLARIGVQGDGSCFYHSVALALNLENYVSKSEDVQRDIAYRLRCSMADKVDEDSLRKIVKRTQGKSPTREELKTALCNPRIWADETAIRLFGDAMDLNIIFLDMSKGELYCGVHHEDALTAAVPDTLVVLWVNKSHFEPLAEIMEQGEHVTKMRVLFSPSDNKKDASLISTLMSRYASQCKLKRR